MDPKLVYAKTPTGDEAVRQRTRVVQRNLRMVLVQVDGNLTVQDLSEKIGNPALVENALLELEEGGFIAPTAIAMSAWEDAHHQTTRKPQVSALSQFSTFGSKTSEKREPSLVDSTSSQFSAFGKPLNVDAPNPSRQEHETPEEHSKSSTQGPIKLKISLRSLMLAALLLPVLALAVAIIYPYSRHKPAIEASLSAVTGAKTTINSVSLSLLPKPQLIIRDIRISDDDRIDELRIDSPFRLLTGSQRRFDSINLIRASLSASQLFDLPAINPSLLAPLPQVPLANIRLEQASFKANNGLALTDMNGEVQINASGRLERATLHSTDRSLLIEARPGTTGVELKIEGRAWKPAGSSISFDALQAIGVLQKNRLTVHSIDTTFLGGLLKGEWQLDWSSYLAMAANAELIRLDSRRISAVFAPQLRLEGDFSGRLKLRGQGNDWATVWAGAEASIDLEITRGLLSGVDLGEASRRGIGATVRGGSTKFDRVLGELLVSPTRLTGRNLRMDSGMVTASGQFSAGPGGQVDGSAVVTIQTSASTVRVPLRVSGVLPDLTAAGLKK